MEKAQVSGVIKVWGPMADPAPLGIGGFALTTFMLSIHNTGWAPPVIWITLAIFYGGATQFIAGMLEFSRNQVFGATVFSTYGSFWLALAFYSLIYLLPGGQFYSPDNDNLLPSVAWFISGFFIFNTVYLVCALQSSTAVFAVLFLLEWAFLCLMIGGFNNVPPGEGATAAGGYFGFFCAIAAFYTSFALTFNAMADREVIPLGAPIVNMNKSSPPPPETGAQYSNVDVPPS